MTVLMNTSRQLSERLMEAFLHKIGVRATVIATSDTQTMIDIGKACKIDLLTYYTQSPDNHDLKDFIGQMRELNPGLRLILLTQDELWQDSGAAADFSADEYVALPIKPEEFLPRLAKHAKQIEANAASAAPAEIECARPSAEETLPGVTSEPEPDNYAQPQAASRYPVVAPEPASVNLKKAEPGREKPVAARKVVRTAGTVLVVLVMVAITALAVTVIKGKANNGTPTFFGYRFYTVVSGSMKGSGKDSFDKGSLILVADIDPRDIRVGDIITFNRESKDQKVTTHRVAEVRKDQNGGLSFITKGDANPAPDDAEVPASIVVGIVRANVPRLGNVILFAQTKTGRFYTLYLPGGAIVLYEVYVLASDRLARVRKRGKTAKPEKETNRETQHD